MWWPHCEKWIFKTLHSPELVSAPSLWTQLQGSLVTGWRGVVLPLPTCRVWSPQDTVLPFPSKGQAPGTLTQKIKELCVENAKAAVQGAGGQVR